MIKSFYHLVPAGNVSGALFEYYKSIILCLDVRRDDWGWVGSRMRLPTPARLVRFERQESFVFAQQLLEAWVLTDEIQVRVTAQPFQRHLIDT